MNLEDAGKQIDKADSFLDKLWKFLGKHWGKLIIILIIFCSYKVVNLFWNEVQKDDSSDTEEITLKQEYFDYDQNGDSILIKQYSDGTYDTIYHFEE